jgi:hypothetical protein
MSRKGRKKKRDGEEAEAEDVAEDDEVKLEAQCTPCDLMCVPPYPRGALLSTLTPVYWTRRARWPQKFSLVTLG